jgi:hypothetical protein
MTGKHKQEELPAQGGNWIDVRDCKCGSGTADAPSGLMNMLADNPMQVLWHMYARWRCPTQLVGLSAVTGLSQATISAS